MTVSVIGAATRDTLLGHTALRLVYSGLLDSYGAILAKMEEIDDDIIKKKVIEEGILILAADGNVVYLGPPSITGDIPLWAKTAVEIAEGNDNIELAESFDLSAEAQAYTKIVQEAASIFEVVVLAAGANSFRGKRRFYPGLSAYMPGETICNVMCWEFKKGNRPEPPIVYCADGKVIAKWGYPGSREGLEKFKLRRKAIFSMPAKWVWSETMD